jgi:hypothetical protein
MRVTGDGNRRGAPAGGAVAQGGDESDHCGYGDYLFISNCHSRAIKWLKKDMWSFSERVGHLKDVKVGDRVCLYVAMTGNKISGIVGTAIIQQEATPVNQLVPEEPLRATALKLIADGSNECRDSQAINVDYVFLLEQVIIFDEPRRMTPQRRAALGKVRSTWTKTPGWHNLVIDTLRLCAGEYDMLITPEELLPPIAGGTA